MADEAKNTPDPTDFLVFQGGALKRLGEYKVGGALVVFSTVDDPDLYGDFFTKQTDFGPHKSTPVFYQHGFDPDLGDEQIGVGTLSIDDKGVWVEADLSIKGEWAEKQKKQRQQYIDDIMALVDKGVLGWSSGTAPHLVRREEKGVNRWEITRWHLGLDASMTPTPAEPRTFAIPLKTWKQTVTETEPEVLAEAEGTSASPIQVELKLIVDNKTTGEAGEPNNTTAMEKEKETPEVVETETKASPVIDTDVIKSAVNDAIAEAMKAFDPRTVKAEPEAPALNLKTTPGDSEMKAYLHYMRTGDASRSLKASNAVDMQYGTDAEGGYAVPTGHYGEIIARRDESSLIDRLGLRRIPGVGTTVNVPIDDEADGEFVSTAEEAGFDLDAPALNTKAFTLVKYTKKVSVSIELLQDEDSNLEAFLTDFVGRGLAKTVNNLIITEAGSNGTETKVLTQAGLAAGEAQDMLYNNDLAPYLEDDRSSAWVMRAATYGDVISLTGNPYLYLTQQTTNNAPGFLLGLPVFFSQKVAAVASNATSVYLGNWNFMGWREAPGLTVLRDPYSEASTGQINFWYYFRAVAGVLQAEAITYGRNSTT